MFTPRSSTFSKLIVVLLMLSLGLQACQPPEEAPPTINPTPEVQATAAIQQTPTATITPSPTSQPVTIAPILVTPTNALALSQRLDQALIDGVEWYIGIEAEDGKRLFTLNTQESFAPASMIKIPIALVVLKILEYRGDTLEVIRKYGIGRNFSELLEAMVVRSEEPATESLEYFARGENRLRNYLDWWGLEHTTFDPRRSTVEDLLLSLKLINTQAALNEEFSTYLLDLMSTYTENDQILLGVMMDQLPQCVFYNKRGTLLNPTIVSDMGMLKCGEKTWYLVIAGTPAVESTATFEDIQASIEEFGKVFGGYIQEEQP